MKRRVLIGLIVGVVLLSVGTLATAATVETPIPSFVVVCTSTGQLCAPPHTIPVTTAGELQVEYDVPGHCSSIRLHILVDGIVVHTTGWLGWPGAPPPFDTLPLTTGLVNLGPVSPGTHQLGLQAEGQVGGCNQGQLNSWGGSGRVLTSDVVPVSIDIKPGGYPNSINLRSKGVVPVAVLTTDDFDASTVDPDTVVFANASPLRWATEDVDGDGDMDLLFHFKTQELDLTESSTEATLTGSTFGGLPIEGTDTVNIVPKDN